MSFEVNWNTFQLCQKPDGFLVFFHTLALGTQMYRSYIHTHIKMLFQSCSDFSIDCNAKNSDCGLQSYNGIVFKI